MEFNIKVIKSEEQYNHYLDQADQLMEMDPEPDSKEGELLETLTILIEEYESRSGYELPEFNDPLLIIKKRMSELNLKQKDLVSVMGDKSVVSRILNGQRNLTYEMIGPLSDLLKIPADMLIKHVRVTV